MQRLLILALAIALLCAPEAYAKRQPVAPRYVLLESGLRIAMNSGGALLCNAC